MAGLFLPPARVASCPTFLMALIVLAVGMTTVQVAVNSFVTIIGPSESAAGRLILTQGIQLSWNLYCACCGVRNDPPRH